MDPGRLGVVDDRRERAVEVQPDHGPGGGADQRGVPLLALGRHELHASSQPRAPLARPEVRLAGEDDREPVQRHRVDGRGGALDAEVERQLFGRGLQRLRVVDGVGRDGAVPVVGAHHVPAGVGGVAGDPSGQAADAGVVEHHDVGLAALDRRLLRLLRLLVGRRRGRLVLGPWLLRDGSDLALGGLLAPGGHEGDAGHHHGDDAQHHDRGGEDGAPVVACHQAVRPRSRAGARSAAAAAANEAAGAGGRAAGRPPAPPAGR